MIRFLFMAKVAAVVTILLIILSNLRPALAALAHLIIVIPSPIQGF